MATYSDAMMGYADFQSTGRYFAAAMAASAVLGTAALYIADGHAAGIFQNTPSLAFVSMGGYVALGLSLVMAGATLGSLSITRRAKRTITISETGVLSQSPKKELFLAREEILGMAVVPGNRLPQGTMLVTADRARHLLIPRWIRGYGACLGELQKLGIPALPPYRRSRAEVMAGFANRTAVFAGTLIFLMGMHSPILQPRYLALMIWGLSVVALGAWLAERSQRDWR